MCQTTQSISPRCILFLNRAPPSRESSHFAPQLGDFIAGLLKFPCALLRLAFLWGPDCVAKPPHQSGTPALLVGACAIAGVRILLGFVLLDGYIRLIAPADSSAGAFSWSPLSLSDDPTFFGTPVDVEVAFAFVAASFSVTFLFIRSRAGCNPPISSDPFMRGATTLTQYPASYAIRGDLGYSRRGFIDMVELSAVDATRLMSAIVSVDAEIPPYSAHPRNGLIAVIHCHLRPYRHQHLDGETPIGRPRSSLPKTPMGPYLPAYGFRQISRISSLYGFSPMSRKRTFPEDRKVSVRSLRRVERVANRLFPSVRNPIWEFRTSPKPIRFGPNRNADEPFSIMYVIAHIDPFSL